MTDDDLDQIESQVGFALPTVYRQVATRFPFRPIGRDWVYWFYNDPSRVIDETLHPFADSTYDQAGWKRGYLTIGESASGDLYVLDTSSDRYPVLFLSHETHGLETEWTSFNEFVSEWSHAPETQNQRFASNRNGSASEEARILRLALLIIAISIGTPLIGLLLIWLFRP